jgi:16S rRNA (guanine1207-N2)-methyltransferase
VTADPALETLLLPLRQGLLQWPSDGVLFLRAREGAPLHELPLPGLVCEQTFKPDADALSAAGLSLNVDASRKYPLVMVLPPRQRDEARALLARAVSLVEPGGRVLVSQGNNEGARSSEKDLESIAGTLHTMNKNRCRAFWTESLHGPTNPQLAKEWLALDAVRRIEDERFVSRPGVFAWDRIDIASELLARHLPERLAGDVADLGAGFGYLCVELLTRCKGIRNLHLYEAEARALDLARLNLAPFEKQTPIEYHWHDVTRGLPRSYDAIVTNPPFHTGAGREQPDIGRRFIAVAAESLTAQGELWLVANRHLPYEATLQGRFSRVRTVAQEAGFKIIHARR